VEQGADVKRASAAKEFARSQIEPAQTARHSLMVAYNADRPDLLILKRVSSMDRLERYAATERRKAHRKLRALHAT
jgi:hypothetical protein